MALTDFLSDEQGNVAGPGSSYVLANKPVDWATEMDELDSSKSLSFRLLTTQLHDHNCISLVGVPLI